MDSGFDPDLLRHLRSNFGEDAQATVEEARRIARRLAAEWNIEIDGWLPGATGSLVMMGHRDEQEVVLRIPVAQNEESLAAFLAFSGHGGVQVLESDSRTGSVLMPRLRPGQTLAQAEEDEAVEACADLILRLRGATGNGLTVAEYLEPTLQSRALPASLRPTLAGDAARLARKLIETSPPAKYLHGDLHHFNVLRHRDQWIAIDPESIMGDPAYECAAFLRNPVPELADRPDLPDLLRARIERFADRLGDPPERIWGWALVRTAQCVWWSDISPFHAPWVKVLGALDELSDVFGRV